MGTVTVAGDGVALLYCAIILLVLAWIIFFMRVGVRVWRKAFGMHDLFMLLGIVLFSVTAALCIAACYYGSGQFARTLPPLTMAKSVKIFYIAEYFYAISAAFIKISVAVALLRIAAARPLLKWALWSPIGANIIAALVFVVGIANICYPIGTLWGEANGTCNLQLNTDVSLFFSAIKFSPTSVCQSCQLFFCGMCRCASCATIIRLKYLTLYSDPSEFVYVTEKIGVWSLTEEGVGIIAGSLPSLRPLLSLRIRISTSSISAAASSNAYPPASHIRQPPSRSVIEMDTFQTLGDNDVDMSDGDSQKKHHKGDQVHGHFV